MDVTLWTEDQREIPYCCTTEHKSVTHWRYAELSSEHRMHAPAGSVIWRPSDKMSGGGTKLPVSGLSTPICLSSAAHSKRFPMPWIIHSFVTANDESSAESSLRIFPAKMKRYHVSIKIDKKVWKLSWKAQYGFLKLHEGCTDHQNTKSYLQFTAHWALVCFNSDTPLRVSPKCRCLFAKTWALRGRRALRQQRLKMLCPG